ncbi:MAG TPA: hypothetical protein VGQ36_14280 [Thermoanaerobaculia bacterium]|jgi:hypothetical protein|nr:hypothetical protein [Thermoanaerobaculia bacterium]
MKPLALALLLAFGGAVIADDPKPDVVDVAREAKAKRKKSTSKVITNADVKKSKGKIVMTNVPDTPIEKSPTLMEQAEARRAAEKIASERRAKYDKLVADLEKELAAIEQAYYDENDLTKRDTEIVKKFNEVKAKLDAARAAPPPES